MKTQASLFRLIIIIILFNSTLFAQLNLTVYTDKDVYDYGETIKLYAKVTNIADTTFEFLAGNYESCQAEFSFNDFNSWEHTACLTLSELLTFKPNYSKIYSWRIEPQSLGLPNKDGIQTIIGTYYFGLADTIYIQAPKFIGGELEISYHVNNFDSVNAISNNLNSDVVFGSDYGEIKSEVWQIEGYDIDSLIQIYSLDSIFISFEKSIWITYEDIVDENPLDYYPLQIGNKWYYERIELENLNDPIHNFIVTDTICVEVIADTLMPNGQKYFVLSKNVLGHGNYVRTSFDGIYFYKEEDSTDVFVYNYFVNLEEYYTVQLPPTARIMLESKEVQLLFGDSVSTLVYNLDYLVPVSTTYAEGIGPYHLSSWMHAPLDYKLIGCYINGKTYGDTTVVGIEENNSETISAEFSLSQNYPNPFNPSTTIEYIIPVSVKSERSKVKISVYDVLGREVQTLVNETKSSGKHQIVFDASNLSSGIYYYSLSINNHVTSKKMILLK